LPRERLLRPQPRRPDREELGGQTRREARRREGRLSSTMDANHNSERRPLRRTPPQQRRHLQAFTQTLIHLLNVPLPPRPAGPRGRARRASEGAAYSGAAGSLRRTLPPPTRQGRGEENPYEPDPAASDPGHRRRRAGRPTTSENSPKTTLHLQLRLSGLSSATHRRQRRWEGFGSAGALGSSPFYCS
jgi:hypothetical protein